MSRPLNQSINQSINKSISQSINQSIDRSVNQQTNQSVSQSVGQSMNEWINQSIIQSINPCPCWYTGNHWHWLLSDAPHLYYTRHISFRLNTGIWNMEYDKLQSLEFSVLVRFHSTLVELKVRRNLDISNPRNWFSLFGCEIVAVKTKTLIAIGVHVLCGMAGFSVGHCREQCNCKYLPTAPPPPPPSLLRH